MRFSGSFSRVFEEKSNKFWGPVLICYLVAISAVFFEEKSSKFWGPVLICYLVAISAMLFYEVLYVVLFGEV